MGFHECKRFRNLGFSFCPFKRFEDHEDDEEPSEEHTAVLPPLALGVVEIGLATPAVVHAVSELARTRYVQEVIRRLIAREKLGEFKLTGGVGGIGEGVVDAVARAFVPQEIIRDAREDQRGEPKGGFFEEGEQEGPGLLASARALAVVAGVTVLAHGFITGGGVTGGMVEKAVTQQIETIIRKAPQPTKGAANPGVIHGAGGAPVGGGGKHKNVSQRFIPEQTDVFGDFMLGVQGEITSMQSDAGFVGNP